MNDTERLGRLIGAMKCIDLAWHNYCAGQSMEFSQDGMWRLKMEVSHAVKAGMELTENDPPVDILEGPHDPEEALK